MITVSAFMYFKYISEVSASDINVESLEIARKNLSLLTMDGLLTREEQLENLYTSYGKSSHEKSLKDILMFKEIISSDTHSIRVKTFKADILSDFTTINPDAEPDIVIADVPYGNLTYWSDFNKCPVERLLSNLSHKTNDSSIIAVIMAKTTKPATTGFSRLEKFHVGKRKVLILKKEL